MADRSEATARRWRVECGLLLALLAAAAGAPAAERGLGPAKGRFLVAERDLHDPNFAETVVLLVDYGESGAMGLIVNWPTAAPVAELIPELEGIDERPDTVWVGGPVGRQLILMLLRSPRELEQAQRVFADVHLSADSGLLEQVIGGRLQVDDFRLYSGYAGWAPGQLDRELEAGGWRVLPAEADLVFDRDPDGVWPQLMQRGFVRWAHLGRIQRKAPPSPDLGRAGSGYSQSR